MRLQARDILNNRFTIKIMNQVFESDEDGMLNLNEIKNKLKLPESKKPSRWTNNYSKSFLESRNLVLKEIKHLGAGATKYYAGDEEAIIGYAMFVSVEFYREVIKAFVELRRGNLTKAAEIAAETMSEADAHYLKRQSRIKGMVWSEACAFSGIFHANKCRDMLMEHPKFKYFEKSGKGKFFVTEDGEDVGYFYNRGNKFSSNTTLRVTPEGRDWLRENRDWFNNATETYINTPEGLH